MKNLKFILLLFVLPFISCNSDDDDSNKKDNNESEFYYEFFTNSKIEIGSENNISVAKIKEGEKTVFRYIFNTEGSPNISDDEIKNILVFEIPSNINQFKFVNKEILKASAYYRSICFCADVSNIAIEEGKISGEKIDSNTWKVYVDIIISNEFGDNKVSFKNSFKKSFLLGFK